MSADNQPHDSISSTDLGRVNLLLDGLLRIAAGKNREDLFAQFATQMSWVFDFEQCAAALNTGNQEVSYLTANLGTETNEWEISQSEKALFNEVTDRNLVRRVHEKDDCVTRLCLPLLVGEKNVGALLLRSQQSNAFRRSEIQLAQAGAAFLALALDRVGRIEELESEQYLLNSLVNSIPDPVFFKDRSGRFIRVNQAMATDAAKKSPEELTGLTDDDIWAGQLPTDSADDERRIMETGEPLINKEENPTTFAGDERWVLVTKMALRDENQEISGIFGIARDITQRKKLQLQLEAALEEAKTASKMKSAFLANTSHEIRTPMNGIVGMSELLSLTELDQRQREYVRAIQQSADALTLLINDILDLSKIEAGRMVLESERFSLSDCVGRAIRTVAPTADEKGLELTCRISPNVPHWLVGDHGRLRQVIVNLIGNAVKFTERGEVGIDVDLAEQDSIGSRNRVRLRFQIRDTGIGIPEEKQDRIFEAFEQADSSTTRVFGGTGLGLSISSQLVRLMNGTIELEASELGKGTTFVFTAEFELAVSKEELRPKLDQLRGLNTLVIDDNRTNRKILEELLFHWSMSCTAVENARDATHAFESAINDNRAFQLVLLDLNMPNMDGYELAQQLNEQYQQWKDCVVIMLSSSLLSEEKRNRSVGIDRFMSKPIISSELLDVILDQFALSAVNKQNNDSAPTDAAPVRILLVEDNRVNQLVATGMLKQMKHEVVVANNGQEALDALEKENFDIVLMDMQMPVMDGREAIRRIRENEQVTGEHLPIVALTAEAMKGDRERCLQAGADEYLAKPVTKDRLQRVIIPLTTGDLS